MHYLAPLFRGQVGQRAADHGGQFGGVVSDEPTRHRNAVRPDEIDHVA